MVSPVLFWEEVLTRIVLNGVGRLGQAVVAAAKEKQDGAVVVAAVDPAAVSDNSRPLYRNLDDVREEFDVIVDASRAEGLDAVLDYALKTGKPVVIAATGHSDAQLARLKEAAEEIPVFKSSNLSVGVNVLRRLTEEAGRLLGPVDAEIVETHHRMKVDAPSGTALTLAEALRDATDPNRPFVYGRSPVDDKPRGGEIGVHAVRGGTVVGEHSVLFLLDDEIVELRHVAQSRQVFGNGAVKAAQFIVGKQPGYYGMDDLLGITEDEDD